MGWRTGAWTGAWRAGRLRTGRHVPSRHAHPAEEVSYSTQIDHRTIATKFGQGTVARIINAANGRIGNSRVYGQESFLQFKNDHATTIPVILKGVPGKGTKPAVVARLPARERETLLAIARVLAGK